MNKLELQEWVITEEDLETGVFAISFVDEPAIEVDFQYFNKVKSDFKSIDDEKRIVIGPIMVPNIEILRRDPQTKELFNCYFSEKTVEMIAHKYMKMKKQSEVTIGHEFKVDGITLVETWLVEDPNMDKSKLYNEQKPKTWMGIFKIDNDEIWENYVKTGEVKGFSVEGNFITDNFDKENIEIIEKLKKLLEKIN